MRTSTTNSSPTATAPPDPFTQQPSLQWAGSTPGGPLPGGGPTPNANVPTFGGMLNALKRRWVLATFAGLLVATAAAVVTWVSMPSGKHVARAVLLFPRPATGSDEAHRTFKDQQYQMPKTRTIINMVLIHKEILDLPTLQAIDDKAREIEEMTDVKWVGDDTLRISMNGNNGQDLELILKKMLHAMIVNATSEALKQKATLLANLTKQEDRLKNQIDSLRKDLRDNAIGAAGIVPTNDGNQIELQLYQKLESEYQERINQAETNLAKNKRQMANVEADLAKEIPPVPSEVVLHLLAQDPRVKRATETVDEKAEILKLAKQTFAADGPQVKKAEGSLKEAEQELADAKAKAKPEIERAAQKDFRNQLLVKKSDLTREAEGFTTDREVNRERLTDMSAQVQTMRARVVANQEIQEKIAPLVEELRKVKSEKASIESKPQAEQRISVFDEATVYPNHNLKQKGIASTAAAFAGFIGILALIAYLEWRTRRVDSVDQVINELNMRVIGTIPAFPSKSAVKNGSAETNQNWRFILNESVNSTRTLLLHTAKTQSMQVIMVTSAMQGEGKTSLASQLATSMATAGLRTLILDCDLRNPSVHRLFDVALTPGCSEILCQEVDVSDAVQPTSVPNLWMIPAGQCSNRVIAALAQGHPLETLFNRLRGQFDFIVVDCCPVLPVADALLIGQHVDGVVFSILQDISQLPKVIDASNRLTSLNIPLLGAVVNGTKVDMHTYGYNYVKQLPA